ncbi:MAG: hypothetical protein ACM3O7_11690 [Acidobacteriota bacterium]
MVSADDRRRWTELLGRLRLGPAPRGEPFDLCRRVLASAPAAPEAAEAARLLLEGAMGDATTEIRDAQETMRLLQAAGRGEVRLAELIPT